MAKKGKIIHFIPTMGGCGSTTVACNVAASLAKTARTVLLDMDLVRGGVASYFDIRARFTIADIMDSGEKLVTSNWTAALAARRFRAVDSRPARLAGGHAARQAGRIYKTAQRPGTHVRFRGHRLDHERRSALRLDRFTSSDINVIVMQLNVPSAKNAERFVGTLRRMAIDSNKIKIVANRYIKKGCGPSRPRRGWSTLGLKISWTIPNDFKTAISAINLREPLSSRLAPRTEIQSNVASLANLLAGKNSVANAA